MPADKILNQLNKDQQEAVVATDGPIIILAGAGSGKTRVLVHKVLYLIVEKHILPNNILMVTFTNKAAGEMKARITSILSSYSATAAYNVPTIGTFHSVCAKLLRREGKAIGISPFFQIFDDQDQLEVMKKVQEMLDISPKEFRPRSVLNTLSHAKNEMIDPASYKSLARGYYQEAVAKMYPIYQSLLKDADALDFDDLLLETIRLFKKDEVILSYYQDYFKYILIDEYQDTNRAQYEIAKLLSQKNKNICVVGDFSQSIYSFRGADFRNLQKFKKDFSGCKVFSLSQNYRSTQRILDAAYSVISNNKTHPVLNLWTNNEKGEDITIFQAESEHNEVEYIIRKIKEEKKKDSTFSYGDVAILYRMNAQSRTIEEVLLHYAVPYILVGGVRFYERKEVKDVLSLLAFLANAKNVVAARRIEKIGKKRFEKFVEFAKQYTPDKLENTDTITLLDSAIKSIDYLSLFDEDNPEDKARLENIAELRSVAIEFADIHLFLENVALVESEYLPDKKSIGENGKPNAVTLMTLHAAKGLEFRMVFLVGMEEGLFPHSQAIFEAGDVEEERRLCYVGITRAREKLFLTYAKRRLIFGQRSAATISRFILELPEDVLERNLIELYDEGPSYL